MQPDSIQNESTINTQTNATIKDRKFTLVTGASGLVGSHLLQQLIAEGKLVKALYRTKVPMQLTYENLEWIKGDILDPISLENALEDVDTIYHCAAMVNFRNDDKSLLYQTNIEGTANVVNAALVMNIKKICFVSSVAALGKAKAGIKVDEKTEWSEETNTSNYGKSKFLAEMEVWRGVAEGLEAVIVNPTIILGAGNWNEGSTKMFKTAYEEFPWFTDGVTGFVDVKDVAKAMIQLMESNISGQRFIVSAVNKSFKEMFSLAATAFGKKPPYKRVNQLMAELVLIATSIKSKFTGEAPLLTKETVKAAQAVVVFDNSKLTNYLPSLTYTPFEETIQRVCEELKLKNNLQ